MKADAQQIDGTAWADEAGPRRDWDDLECRNFELERDVARLTELNQTLTESEQRLRIAIGRGGVGLWIGKSTDVTTTADWSPRMKEIFGIPLPVEVTHEMFLERVHPDDRERVDASVREALSGVDGGRYSCDYRVIRMPDGALRWISARAQGFFDEEGRALCFIGTVLDVTESKLLEDENVRLREDFTDLFDEAPIPYVHEGLDTHFIRANGAALKVLGIRPEEIAETVGSRLVANTPEMQLLMHDALELFAQGKEISGVLLELRRKDNGHPVWVQWWSRPAVGRDYTRTMFVDVTDRLLLERAKAALEFTLKSGQIGDWDLDLIHDTSHRSLRHDQCFGYSEPIPDADWGVAQFLNHVHPADRAQLETGFREAVEGLRDWEAEFRVVWPDGSVHWILGRGSMYGKCEGKATRMLGIVMDITDRKRAEEDLQSSEQLARGQVEALTRTLDALAKESAPDRLVEHVLRTLTEQFGAHSSSVWRRDEVSDLIGFEFAFEEGKIVTKADPRFAGIDLSLPMEDFWPWPEVFRNGKPSVIEDIRTVKPFALRDRLLPLGIITVLLIPMSVLGRVEGAIGLRFTQQRGFRPEEIELAQALANQAMLVTQLTRLSAQSRESAVLAERNRMAREIHDTIAQGLTGVIVQLEAVGEALSRGLPARATEHLERAGDLARESLQEARRSVRALRPQALEDHDLCTALEEMIRHTSEQTGLNAEFVCRGAKREVPACWEENLLRIAQEALTNVLRHAHASEFTAQLVFERQQLLLTLHDNGRGFDPEQSSDGFGLLGMRERVEEMGGKFSIVSSIGSGTDISIDLPLTDLLEEI